MFLAGRESEADVLTYAIGDLHGCIEPLRATMDAIARHARGRVHQLVFLGDYIDRGPDSRALVEFLMTPRNEGRVVCLMGNHEQMLLRVVHQHSAEAGVLWMSTGGRETLRSYGLAADDLESAHAIPKRHLDWMARRPSVYATGDRVYVHAGIEPSKALHKQGRREFLWIRERFLTADPDLFVERRHIVHGHTPVWAGKPQMAAPELLSHRTNLDTGAYTTATLVVAVFVHGSGGPVDLLSVA